jgi:hypothetical protein
MLTDWSVNIPPSATPHEGLSGLIERVTFHSEETGFAVLRVKAKGQGEPEGGRSPCERERGRSGLQVLCPMNRGSLGPRDECNAAGRSCKDNSS